MTATDNEVRALVPRQAAEVDLAEAKALADVYLANKAQGERAVGLFPNDLTPVQAGQLARLALMYKLDPLAGELTIYESRPLITLDGRLRIANDHPQFDGIQEVRPADDEERSAWHCKETEDMWVATVWRKDRRFPFVGYGRSGGAYERNTLVKGSERTGYNPGRGPELARKRAIVNALRQAFSMPLPSFEDESERVVMARVIDHRTGEIQEPGEPSIRATDGQIAAIHIAAAKLGLIEGYADNGYKARLLETCGVESSTQLSEGDAAAFLSMLQAELAEREGDATDAEEAQRTAEAEARGDAVRARTGKRARDLVTLADDDEAPSTAREPASAPPSDVAADDDSADIATVAAAEMGGVVVGIGMETPRASDKQKGYIERLLSDVSLEWADAAPLAFQGTPPSWESLNVADAARLIDWLLARKKQGAGT